MGKKRVHEIAKELNKDSKDIIATLKQHGVEVKSHMSTITDEDEAVIRKAFAPKPVEKKPEAPAANTNKQASVKKDVPVRNEGNAPRREGQNHSVNRDNRNGGNRDGQNRYENRDNRNGGNRDNRNGGNRDGQNRFENRDNRNGGNRDNRNVGNRDGQNRYENRDNRNGGNRDNRNSGNRDGQNRYENRDNRNGGNRDNRNGGNRDGQNRFENRDNRNGGNRDGQNRFENRDNRNNRPANTEGGNRFENKDRYSAPKVEKPERFEKQSKQERVEKFERKQQDNNNRRRDDFDTMDGRGKGSNKNKNQNQSDNFGGKNKKNNQNNKVQKNKKGMAAPAPAPKQEPVEETIKTIQLPPTLTLKELADTMKIAPAMIIKKLFLAGKIYTLNSELTFDEASEIALEYNYICEEEVQVDVLEELMKDIEDAEDSLEERCPVVCVMGHVDHGKTSLLDAIRKTRVTAGEAGGITQHIGAYMVNVDGQKITFLDTPGHEAFTSMRMRGAQATDIAILVVAADDGVMPQTVEAINHAKAAGVEVIVAINKIDKESANVDRVKQELMEYGLIAEDWGGSTVFVPVSAHTKEGIDTLLDMVILTAEMMELKANPNRKARGIVIEAQLDKGRGPVATVLVQKGTLKVGDSIVAGNAYGKVRAMVDDKGRNVKTAGPSTPVEILGLNEVPFAGEIAISTATDKEARLIAETFNAQGREKMLADTKQKMSLDDLFDQIQAGNVKELNIIVKADVQGSVEAVKQSLVKLSNEEVAVKIIHGGVGAINESDVILASASNAIIIGFNVRPDNTAKSTAEQEKVDVRLYRVIYNAIEDIQAAMKGMLDPIFEEKVQGHADVRQTYRASGVGTIAGSYVTDGLITRNSQVRIVRDGIVVYEGHLASLKRFKDDVKEVKSGFECGIVFEKFNDVKEGDQIEAFIMQEIPR